MEETLRSDETRVLVVPPPERIVVAETLRLVDDVKRRGIRLGGIIANYVTPQNGDDCDRSLRAFEVEELRKLGDVTIVERRDAPVTRLEELARVVPV